MVTINLDNHHQALDEILRTVESGESVRLMRGENLVALITPASLLDNALWNSCNWDDETWFAAASEASAKALAQAYPDDDFSDWDPSHATR